MYLELLPERWLACRPARKGERSPILLGDTIHDGLAAHLECKRMKEEVSLYLQSSTVGAGAPFAAAIAWGHQSEASLTFQCQSLPVTLQGTPRPSALDWLCVPDSTSSVDFNSMDWGAPRTSDSPSWRWFCGSVQPQPIQINNLNSRRTRKGIGDLSDAQSKTPEGCLCFCREGPSIPPVCKPPCPRESPDHQPHSQNSNEPANSGQSLLICVSTRFPKTDAVDQSYSHSSSYIFLKC